MTINRISQAFIHGSVLVPSSKSMGHRMCICAGLSGNGCTVDNIAISKDIEATNRCLTGLGVTVKNVSSRYRGRTAFQYSWNHKFPSEPVTADCGESGSTLRFFIPLGALCNVPFSFEGHGKLVSRPLQPYYDIFDKQELRYRTAENGNLPLTVAGKLRPGTYVVPGDISSQFVSGLLFALPLLEGDSTLEILPPLESASYIKLTLSSLRQFGINIIQTDDLHYIIPGNQQYQTPVSRVLVEGDWSQAAFWLVAGAIGCREGLCCCGLSEASLQGDKAVLKILRSMAANITVQNDCFTVTRSRLNGCVIDAADCPDLVPVLSVAAAVAEGTTHIINAGRLRIKECDRLAAMHSELMKLGAEITEEPEGLLIKGKPDGLPGGASVDAWNDHRIAMSMAVAALVCKEPITLTGGESVSKSYPEFWNDYASVGGKAEKID
ncbi:MAG: 3-phosphoshikimate 1-carboxyvinyltransferase [Acidaminococcaceae bacterium]|nr:3-phosphoshikimate 1-carboxyvinyltransferase [Acidaminococcaceae bacterium]